MTSYLGAEGRWRQTGGREGHVAGCRYSGCAPLLLADHRMISRATSRVAAVCKAIMLFCSSRRIWSLRTAYRTTTATARTATMTRVLIEVRVVRSIRTASWSRKGTYRKARKSGETILLLTLF